MLWLGEFGQSQRRIGKSSKSMRRCSQNSAVIMLHLSAWLYCRAESLCYNGKKSFECMRSRAPPSLGCSRFEPPHGSQRLSKASEEASAGPHTPDGSQTDKICSDSGPVQHPSLLFFIFFILSFLPFIPLSFRPVLSLPLPLHSSPPCNQGPLKWAEGDGLEWDLQGL